MTEGKTPLRCLAYMAGNSTPFFISIMEAFVERMGSRVSELTILVGDRYQFLQAKKRSLNVKIRLIYQHERFNPFHAPMPDTTRLAQLEQRYGIPNLWRYVLAQRMIDPLPHDRKTAYLAAYLEYYEALFHKTRPDVFITGGQDSLPFLAAHEVFKRNGAIPLILTPGWIPGWVFVVDNEYLRIPGVPELYESLKGRELTPEEKAIAAQIRDSYLVKKIRPTAFLAGHSIPAVPSPLRFLKILARRIRYEDRYFDAPLKENMKRSVLVRARMPFQKAVYQRLSHTSATEKNALYYPLHYEPEASIDVLGTPYRDQLELIERIASCLPVNCTLYVKEHPHMNPGARPIGFYRKLARINGVKLLDQGINGHEVIWRCKGVVTIAGTTGFEALFYGKPVLLMGHTFYEDFREGIFTPGSWEKMVTTLKEMVSFAGFDPVLLDKFVVAVIKRSFPGLNEITAPGYDEPENHAALAKALETELEFRAGKEKIGETACMPA